MQQTNDYRLTTIDGRKGIERCYFFVVHCVSRQSLVVGRWSHV